MILMISLKLSAKALLFMKITIVFLVVSATYLVFEPKIVDCGRLTVTTEEVSQGDAPEYKTYTYGSHEYEDFTIVAHYPSGLSRKIPFHASMVSNSDYEKFSILGKQEIEVFYQQAKSILKIEVVLPKDVSNHIIIFNSHGGSHLPDIRNIPNGSTVVLPIPTKSGYVFLGWYPDEEFKGDALDHQTPITSSMVLHAKWEALLS
jgi:uncharacterized repeat protein (TIGR02543 family)